MTVETRMTRTPLTISPNGSCRQALLLMDAAEIDHLPVCDGSRLVGLLSREEMLERAGKLLRCSVTSEKLGELLPFVNVSGLMTLDPESVAPNVPLEEATMLMREHGITAVPVVEQGELVGILTLHDLMPSLEEAPPRHAIAS